MRSSNLWGLRVIVLLLLLLFRMVAEVLWRRRRRELELLRRRYLVEILQPGHWLRRGARLLLPLLSLLLRILVVGPLHRLERKGRMSGEVVSGNMPAAPRRRPRVASKPHTTQEKFEIRFFRVFFRWGGSEPSMALATRFITAGVRGAQR